MTEVTLTSTAHVWRVSFEMPYGSPGTVQGYGETVLINPADAPGKVAGLIAEYRGLPAGAAINRVFDRVKAETVKTMYGEISFDAIAEALPKFFERWAAEDIVMYAQMGATGSLIPPAPPAPEPVKKAKESDPYKNTPKPAPHKSKEHRRGGRVVL
jgi:hypothetical protein